MGKPDKEKKKREQKRLAEKKDPVLQAKRKAEKREQFKENIKFILRFTAKAVLPTVFAIFIFSLIFKKLPVLPQNKAFCGIGFIGAALLGVGISLFLYGKRAYKILAPVGIALAVLSFLLISKPGLTSENAPAFYYYNICTALLFVIFYVMFRDAVHSWLRGRNISETMIKKSKHGAKNFWWYEELHREFGLSSVYTLNKAFTVFFAVHSAASVLFGWAEPLFFFFSLSSTLLAVLAAAIAEFAQEQRTMERYGCKFVLCKLVCKHGRIIDSSVLDIIASFFPLFVSAGLWVIAGGM